MAFTISGLDPTPFLQLYGLPDQQLAARGVVRHVADARPGFPDRIELRDAEPGEALLLLNFEHQPAHTPYRARHAIFVREGALEAAVLIDAIPDALAIRPISLRAFDAAGMMVDAELVEGSALEPAICQLFERKAVAYLHAHFARRGCYAARVDRS